MQQVFVGPYVRQTVDEHILHDRRQGGGKEGSVQCLNVHYSRSEVLSKEVRCIGRVIDKVAVEVSCIWAKN